MERYSASEQDTEALGRALVQRLQPGAVVAFTGDLGAGKTAFVRGMAQGLGIHQPHLYHRERIRGGTAAPVPL